MWLLEEFPWLSWLYVAFLIPGISPLVNCIFQYVSCVYQVNPKSFVKADCKHLGIFMGPGGSILMSVFSSFSFIFPLSLAE